MKIKEIRAAAIDITPTLKTTPRVPKLQTEGIGSVMARYPEIKRAQWGNPWKRTACVVTAEDGTWGLGITTHGGPVEQIINGHFAGALVGQDTMATEKCWDVMRRISAQYGSAGLASYAISAVDNALWNRGAAPRYKARPRHRARTTAYWETVLGVPFAAAG